MSSLLTPDTRSFSLERDVEQSGWSVRPVTPVQGATRDDKVGLTGGFCTVQPSPRSDHVIYATDPSPARGPDPQAAREAGGSPGVTTPGADCDFMDVPSVECLHEAIFAGSRPPSRQLQHPATTAKPASQNPSTPQGNDDIACIGLFPTEYSLQQSDPLPDGGGRSLSVSQPRVGAQNTPDFKSRTVISGSLLKLSKPGCFGRRKWHRRLFIIRGQSLQYFRGNFARGEPRQKWDMSECSYQNVGVFQGQHNTIEIQVQGRTLMLSCFTQDDLEDWLEALGQVSKQEETYEKPRVSSSVQPHPATHPATTHPLLNSRDDIRVPSVLDRMLERLPEVADKAPPLQNSMDDSRPVAQGRAIETSSVPSIKGIGRSAEGETGAIEGKILDLHNRSAHRQAHVRKVAEEAWQPAFPPRDDSEHLYNHLEIDRLGRKENGPMQEWQSGQRPPTPPITDPGFEELNSGALKQWYEIDKGTGDVRASEQPDYHGNSWAQGGVRGDENPPQMFMKQHVGSSVKDEIGAGQWLQLDCSDMRTSEESAKPAALLRMQLNEGLGRTKEENNTPVGQKQGEDLDGYTPFDAASLQIHSNMKALEVNLEPSPHNSHRRGFLIENDARTLQLDLNTAVVKEDFAMASALRGMSSRASIPRSAVTGPSLPPRPNFGSFRSIHLYTRAEAGARRGRRSPSPAAVGSRRSVSPPFRAPSPTPSRVGSIGGKSNASTNSKMDILRFQTYDGQVRKPSSMADYEDIGSIFANPVQAYVPGASLKGTTAVSPLTTPRTVSDSFQSYEFQHGMGGQASVSTSPKLGAIDKHDMNAYPGLGLGRNPSLSYIEQNAFPSPSRVASGVMESGAYVPSSYHVPTTPSPRHPTSDDGSWSTMVTSPSASKPVQAGPTSWLVAAQADFKKQFEDTVVQSSIVASSGNTRPQDMPPKMGWGSYTSARRFGPRPPDPSSVSRQTPNGSPGSLHMEEVGFASPFIRAHGGERNWGRTYDM